MGPFGLRRVTYADYTASGRSLAPIEDYIRDAVLPLYANTHSESSGTGLQTTRFREDARRDHPATPCGGDPAEHAVHLRGSGSTGAIDKLVACLNLRLPADLDARYDLRDRIPVAERPVVFIGPYEHHSNELPWRESIADVSRSPRTTTAGSTSRRLERALHRTRRPAAQDRQLLGRLQRHRHPVATPARSRCCCTGTGRCRSGTSPPPRPYVEIEMAPHAATADATPTSTTRTRSSSRRTSSSAGPGRPACWWRAASCSTTRVPSVPGGGTVEYVNPLEHVYLRDHRAP